MNLPARFNVWRTRCFWLGISIFILQVASMFISISWSYAASRVTLRLGGGMFHIQEGVNSAWASPWPSGASIHTGFEAAFWPRQYGWAGMGPQPLITECPLWVPALIAMLPVFVTRRNNLADLCPECDYDLTGNTTGTCPECGVATMQASLPLRTQERTAAL